MRVNFLFSLVAVALMIAGCLLPWMTVETKGITITGINTAGTSFGKPGYFHFLWAGLYLLLVGINKLWATRIALVFAAFNIAWALRNFLLIPACAGGECPSRNAGLYLLLAASIAMFFAPVLKSDAAVSG
ncbi:MAG TPA: hypothetical protein VM871_04690 [Flavisolibacter sp.]|jgi:hypothetical protein|nr:hypothetical protein [Flavisolibacter sp.]